MFNSAVSTSVLTVVKQYISDCFKFFKLKIKKMRKWNMLLMIINIPKCIDIINISYWVTESAESALTLTIFSEFLKVEILNSMVSGLRYFRNLYITAGEEWKLRAIQA